jgi:hypothetical protein
MHSIVGDEAIVMIPGGALRDGEGEPTVLLSVRRQPEELEFLTMGHRFLSHFGL